MSRNARILRCLVGTLVCVILSACATPWSKSVVALPNGYYLRGNHAGDIWIIKGDSRSATTGPVAAYCVLNSVVAGALGVVPESYRAYTNDLEFKGTAETRYFILDTKTGHLESGLHEATWRMRLVPLSRFGSARL